MAAPLIATACSRTDPGLVRQNNEDSSFYNLSRNVFVVCDGMGGTAGGEVASELFIETVKEDFAGWPIRSVEESKKRVRDSFTKANSAILKESFLKPYLKGMGCTAELLLLTRDAFVLGHVGDSRTYRLRSGHLSQLTKDHSLVQQQVDEGIITEKERKNSMVKNVLLRAVGNTMELTIDMYTGDIMSQDIYLLCSDGLHNMVSDQEILAVLSYDGPLELRTQMLINMANDAGGKDNITAMLVEVI